MFSWFKKKEEKQVERSLIGDLDLLVKKQHFIRYQGKEWRVPDLTAGEYAAFCALLDMLDRKAKENDTVAVEKVFEEIFALTIPDLPRKIVRKMSLIDSQAMFVAILKYYGFDYTGKAEKKKNQ